MHGAHGNCDCENQNDGRYYLGLLISLAYTWLDTAMEINKL